MSMEPSRELSQLVTQLADHDFCYLTTTGRVTGRPHEIEIWFGARKDSLYLLSGGGRKADWVKNLLKNPSVRARIGNYTFHGEARLVEDKEEERMARYLLAEKYNELEEDNSPDEWARTALAVAIDLKPLEP
jgi:deazaflavin-dependent oxidoreductase (nitroreductase family)